VFGLSVHDVLLLSVLPGIASAFVAAYVSFATGDGPTRRRGRPVLESRAARSSLPAQAELARRDRCSRSAPRRTRFCSLIC
jgi:hypothetical protein